MDAASTNSSSSDEYSVGDLNEEDDEGTIEEEELHGTNDEEGEIDDLQREQDIPIDELMKLYGYPAVSTASGSSYVANDYSGSGASTSEEDILSSGSLTLNKHEISQDLLGDCDRPTSVDELVGSLGTPSTSTDPPSNSAANLDCFYRMNDEDDDSDDDADFVPNELRKKEVKIGPEYQADVPEFVELDSTSHCLDVADDLQWSPNAVTIEEKKMVLVEEYLCRASKLHNGLKNGNLTDEIFIHDDEQALAILKDCNFNTEEALHQKQLEAVSDDELRPWSEEEIKLFEEGLMIYGKSFYQIQRSKLPSKKVGDLVRFYYLWKKTERHDLFVQQVRFEKRQYTLNPCTTDYADHFLNGLDGGPQVPVVFSARFNEPTNEQESSKHVRVDESGSYHLLPNRQHHGELCESAPCTHNFHTHYNTYLAYGNSAEQQEPIGIGEGSTSTTTKRPPLEKNAVAEHEPSVQKQGNSGASSSHERSSDDSDMPCRMQNDSKLQSNKF